MIFFLLKPIFTFFVSGFNSLTNQNLLFSDQTKYKIYIIITLVTINKYCKNKVQIVENKITRYE